MSEMKTLTLNGKTYDSFVDPVARQLSEALAVINSASGENIVLSDASGYRFPRFSIYGKTTQDGTPTLDAPVELVSVGDSGSITVSVTGRYDAQSMTITTPNGLPGIPVASGGNYTDANGQQWVCDEIDLARGMYVQRIGFTNLTDANWSKNDRGKYYAYKNRGMYSDAHRVLCTHIYGGATSDGNKDNVIYINANHDIRLNITLDDDTVEAVTNAMNGAILMGVIASYVETPLSEEELATYADLHTYRNRTTISNDASAYMELEYVMDAKKYIDYLVGSGGSGGAAPAKLANVTLLASAWKGSDSLYSQVVTIAGVTPYSKVDLLPSVEQLAVFYNKDVTFMTENEDGVVTVYAIGELPTNNYTMQVSITEVIA
jgi:hypothetical protein